MPQGSTIRLSSDDHNQSQQLVLPMTLEVHGPVLLVLPAACEPPKTLLGRTGPAQPIRLLTRATGAGHTAPALGPRLASGRTTNAIIDVARRLVAAAGLAKLAVVGLFAKQLFAIADVAFR